MIGFPRIAVGRDRSLMAEANLCDIGLVDIGAQPNMIEIGERHHRRPGHDAFAELGLPNQDHAVERRAQDGIAEHDLRQLERFLRVADVGVGEFDLPLGGVLQRLIALMRGCRLPPRGIGLVALLDGAGTLLLQRKSARLYSASRNSRSAASNSTVRCAAVEILLRRGKLAVLHFQRRLVDRHLLAVIGIIEPRDQRAGIHPLPLIERQLDDPGLHGLEAEHALMRFDVAGNRDGRRQLRPKRPVVKSSSFKVTENGCRSDDDGDSQCRPISAPHFFVAVSIFDRRSSGACIALPPFHQRFYAECAACFLIHVRISDVAHH